MTRVYRDLYCFFTTRRGIIALDHSLLLNTCYGRPPNYEIGEIFVPTQQITLEMFGGVMVTTVTTATTATIMSGETAYLALLPILGLVVFLVQKEIFGGLEDRRVKQVSQSLNIAILPLVIIFVATAIFHILSVLH